MARIAGKEVTSNGATTAVAEPNDFYDSLSEDRKEAYEEIGTLGYRANRGTGNLWFATLMSDPQAEPIGPAEDIFPLVEMIKDIVFEDDPSHVRTREVTLETDGDGNTFLPGAEETVTEVDIPELRQPSLDYHAYKTERLSALGREVEAKEILDHLMHKHEKELPVDKETGSRYFKVGSPNGRAVIIDLVKGDKIKSRVVDEAA